MSFRNPSHYTMNMMNRSQSNFNQAFMPNQNLIPQRDVKNYGNLIQNNVNDNILSEIISEYTVHVDSKDRDITIYPNPYSFVVSLGGFSSNKTKDANGNPITVTGVPNPRIDMNFRNVKYIKLKYLMLPRYLVYNRAEIVDGSGYEYTIPNNGSTTILSNYRYLLLKIKEIKNDKLYSTDDSKNDCFIIYRDSNYSDAVSDLWFATQPVKIFYDVGLKNLSKLTIQILTPNGDELRLQYSGDNSGNIQYDEVNGIINDETTPSSDFYSNFGENIQTSMEFELGVCENQLNNQKNYR